MGWNAWQVWPVKYHMILTRSSQMSYPSLKTLLSFLKQRSMVEIDSTLGDSGGWSQHHNRIKKPHAFIPVWIEQIPRRIQKTQENSR